MINFRPVIRIIGILMIILGLLMLTGMPFSYYFRSGDQHALLYSALINILLGLPLWLLPDRKKSLVIKKREGYLIVAMGWLAMVTSSTLPYLFSGVIPEFYNAFFESVSGMTTTGATILEDIEATPRGILYWRSLTQWIGGMGIIVLTVAIFPLLGIGGIELFVAEAPGPTSDKIHPRIQDTAKRLWQIYLALTLTLGLILYFVGGMTVYDAVNHAFTTMATGGFSTMNASLAAFDSPAVHYPVIVFMFLAGTNYTVIYFGLTGRFRKVWQSDEFKAYLGLILFLTIVVTLRVHSLGLDSWEESFRDSIFQIVSIVTTTGYVTADYTAWSTGLTMLFFVMLFSGACAGSTSGGIKLIRHLVFFKNSILEFKRLVHPRAILPLKINEKVVPPRIMTHIIIFLLIYLIIFVFGSIILSIFGLDFMTAAGAMATSLGNVGPAVGNVGPVDNFAWLPAHVKLFLAFIMLLGRLELFTILVLFSPYFWRTN